MTAIANMDSRQNIIRW